MDRPATASECRAQAVHCRMLADTAADERVQALAGLDGTDVDEAR
jgi:hypothetical protein